MSFDNPFRNLPRDQVKEILKTGLIRGKPISSRQRFHLERLVPASEVEKEIEKEEDNFKCDHPIEKRIVSITGKEYCKKCLMFIKS